MVASKVAQRAAKGGCKFGVAGLARDCRFISRFGDSHGFVAHKLWLSPKRLMLLETYETAIENIRSMLAKFERERVGETATLTESQTIELDEMILDLDDQLEVEVDMFKEQELMELLDAEMVE